jgi:AcrR family transcriptional regulator
VHSRSEQLSRSDRRRLTQDRILNAARRHFSRHGYDQTTIREIATTANVDPALVLRYFTSKERLFQQVTATAPEEPVSGAPEDLVENLLTQLGAKLDEEPVATLAMLRSMLSRQQAAQGVRASIAKTGKEVAGCIEADRPEIRAGLVGSLTTGVIVARYILRLEGIKDASTENILELLRPCIRYLVGADGKPETPDSLAEQGT